MKPLGRKTYGSIPHIEGSRLGPGDHKISPGQRSIALDRPRDRHDMIFVSEKLDGSCCGVTRINGEIIALVRSGHRASSSKYVQHHMFDKWVRDNASKFSMLPEGCAFVGEWLAQAHGVRYDLKDRSPWPVFDLFGPDGKRRPWIETRVNALRFGLTPVPIIQQGSMSCSLDQAKVSLGERGFYGATDPAEGVVWRVERRGQFDFMCKWVRADKEDGILLPEISGMGPVWNWKP